jgi:hypothetical protein
VAVANQAAQAADSKAAAEKVAVDLHDASTALKEIKKMAAYALTARFVHLKCA